MAVKYGFYNSISGDRKYDAFDFTNVFDSMLKDGVYQDIGDKFAVSPLSGLTVAVGTGRAWFNKTYLYTDAVESLTLDNAEALLNRIDSIVLEFDITNRINSIKIVKGSPASSPVPPTLQHTETLNQYAIANVRIGAGVTTITESDITNIVGTVDCPYALLSINPWPVISSGTSEPDENTLGYGIDGSLYFAY